MTGAMPDYSLEANSELRLETDAHANVQIKLLNGSAEIFGMELLPAKPYSFSHCKIAVYTYHGAKVEVSGRTNVEYTSTDTPMAYYLNLHLALESERRRKLTEQKKGPVSMILGVGKTSLTKILSNYAVRNNSHPLLIDLDVKNGHVLFPGVLSAVKLEAMWDPEQGLNLNAPICFYYGRSNPKENVKLFRKLTLNLASCVNDAFSNNEKLNSVGAFIMVPDFSNDIDQISFIQEHFKVTSIFVVGNERLHNSLSKLYENSVRILKIPKSAGIVSEDEFFRNNTAKMRIRNYFYGYNNEFCPYSLWINFDEIEIRKFGDMAIAPSSALPLGMSRKLDETHLATVSLTPSLVNCILAVSAADRESQIETSNCLGFLTVMEVDMEKKKFLVLSPLSGELPKKYLLLGNIKWFEK